MQHFGATDCERIAEAFLSQPVNAITSLAFVVAGLVIAYRRPDRGWLAVAVALVGVGSFVAHGPRWPASEWLHDVTIAWVLVVIVADIVPRTVMAGAIPGLGLMFAVTPAANEVVLVALAAGVIGRELLPSRRTRATMTALGILALGAFVGTLSRTGWPLCDPHSLLQGHAVWHVLAAAALAVWGSSAGPAARGPRPAISDEPPRNEPAPSARRDS